jgi:hypothetical protein
MGGASPLLLPFDQKTPMLKTSDFDASLAMVERANARPAVSAGNPADQRLEEGAADAALTEEANALLTELQDSELAPLADNYPRIVNHIAALWTHPGPMRDYFRDLLFDRRGNRQGFPSPYLRAIRRLQDRFEARQ